MKVTGMNIRRTLLTAALIVFAMVIEAQMSFVSNGQDLTGYDSWDIRLIDIDGDGDLDAFIVNAGPNRVWFNISTLMFFRVPACKTIMKLELA